MIKGLRGTLRRFALRTSASLVARWRQHEDCHRICLERGFYPCALDYMSPVPDLDLIPNDTFETPCDLSVLGLREDDQLRTLRRLVREFGAEAAFPTRSTGDRRQFHLDQDKFTKGDAVVLHALIRSLKPRRVVEVGSGHSSRLIGSAAQINRAEGQPLEHLIIDPFARRDELPTEAEAIAIPVERMEVGVFEALEAADILFIDSSHMAKFGSDVLQLVLNVLPVLRRGVVVHFHDIYLPFHYPRAWLERGYFYNESYFLHAFLIANQSYEIMLAHHFLDRRQGAAFRHLITEPNGPTSLWLRKTYSNSSQPKRSGGDSNTAQVVPRPEVEQQEAPRDD